MDNPAVNESFPPFHAWVGPTGWHSAASTQRPLPSPQGSSEHLSSERTPAGGGMRISAQSCLGDPGGAARSNNTHHHSATYEASDGSSSQTPSSFFTGAAARSASRLVSFAQQSRRTPSDPLAAQTPKTLPPPSLSHPNHGAQPFTSHSLPPPLSHSLFRPRVSIQRLPNRLQHPPTNLPSCGHHVNTAQAASEGANMESVGAEEDFGSSTCQEQPQWTQSSHCRAAVHRSDGASHFTNHPSLHNASPQPDNKTRRSELLHRRAQLLKQLAEMDQLLDSIPADESSHGQSQQTDFQAQPDLSPDCPSPLSDDKHDETFDKTDELMSEGESEPDSIPADESGRGQSQQTGFQAQPDLSPDCPSPLSDDKHDETFDKTDELMSEGESEIMENSSAETDDDSDPDYSPNSDVVSDLQSDSDGSVCDESGRSSFSTPMDEKPPHKKPHRELSLSEGNNGKGLPEMVVLPSSNSKGQRVYDRRNYCLFCMKPQSKMSRHIERVHSDREEVAVAFQYPLMSQERRRIWKRLINQGNFLHNKNVIKSGKGQLVALKRPNKAGQGRDFLHCLYCHGLFWSKGLNRHIRKCPERVNTGDESAFVRKRIVSRCALEVFEDLGISDGFKSILGEMIYDDVTKTVINDKIVLQFGQQMFDQFAFDVSKYHYIRQNLRQIGRLVLEAQKTTPLKKLEDFFVPSNFQHVVSAVKVLAGFDPENVTFSVPSLAIRLGYHLQKARGIVEANAVKRGDTSLAKSARDFLVVYRKKWNALISSGAVTSLKEIKLTYDQNVPLSFDVKLLNYHLENVHRLAETQIRDNLSVDSYASLARVTLARTILFNRRKPSEVATIQLMTFMSRKRSTVLDGLDVSVTDLERTLCGLLPRMDIRGSSGRMVPVLLKPSLVSAMELLVKVRETCGVPDENPFLFGRPNSLTAYKGSKCINQFGKECGAKNPQALTASKILKHYPKMLQLMNLGTEETAQISGPQHLIQTLQANGKVQPDEMDTEEGLLPELEQQGATWNHSEDSSTSCTRTRGSRKTTPDPSAAAGPQGDPAHRGKQKWEEAEVQAVERHMMEFIQQRKVPQKSDCVPCLEAEPTALRNRSWKSVKYYIRNRITALNKEKGASRA